MGLANKEASKFARRCREPEQDLKQLGIEGLIEAVDKYDVTTGNAFSSIAVPCIRKKIMHYLRDNRGLTRVPRSWQETYYKVARQRKELAALGRDVSLKDAAIAIGIDGEEWELIKEATRYLPHTPIEGEDGLIIDPVDSQDLPEFHRIRLGENAVKFLVALPARERMVVQEHVLNGVSAEVLAGDVNLPVHETRVLIREVLEQLRSQLEDVYAS